MRQELSPNGPRALSPMSIVSLTSGKDVRMVVVDTILVIALVTAAGGMLVNARWLKRHTRRPHVIAWTTLAMAVIILPCAFLDAFDHSPHPAFSIGIHIVGWAALGILVLAIGGNRVERPPTSRPRRVLAVGAHPDDLELGCGATLARCVDSGYEVRGIVLSNGERGGDRHARPAEASTAAAFLGAESVTLFDFPDTRLATKADELVRVIEGIVTEFEPDIILTHSVNDAHQDHQAVHMATVRAARFHSSILCYESPSVTMDFQPTVFVDVTDYLGVKVTAIETHRDQSRKPYMSGERIRAMASYRGGQAKIRHAEGYEPVRLLAVSTGMLP